MKSIYNWDKATVCDIEADNLLDEATTVHVLSYKLDGEGVSSLNGVKEKGRISKFFKYHIDNKIPIVGHNFTCYDVPLIEKIYRLDLSDLMVIDTLPLSWYLNMDRNTHGLDSFLQDYGVKKPKIDDWENLSYEEYKHRCQEDVKINHFLWEDFKARLIDMYSLSKEEIDIGEVGGKRVSRDEVIFIDSLKGLSIEEHINRILTFLMFQADVSRLQEEVGWLVDEEMVKEEGKRLEGLLEEATKELESVMPKVPKYVKRTPPKNPYKKNGELSASGQAWEDRKSKIGVLNEHGHPLSEVREVGAIHELVRYDPPNINSSDQVKSFLFSKGWKPQTFKYVRDDEAFEEWIKSKPEEGSPRGAWQAWSASRPEDRAIPQINMEDEDRNKELCDSVVDLIEEVPEIKALANYSVISHRYRFLTGKSGIVNNIDANGRVKARMGGLTNTLRWKHAGLVNLPKSDKPFSSSIRGCLIAGEGNVSIGSDISSLIKNSDIV